MDAIEKAVREALSCLFERDPQGLCDRCRARPAVMRLVREQRAEVERLRAALQQMTALHDAHCAMAHELTPAEIAAEAALSGATDEKGGGDGES